MAPCFSLLAIAAAAPLLISSGFAAPAQTFEAKCLAFRPENYITNSSRTVLEYVASGSTLALTDNVASCGRTSQAVATNLCRVGLSIPTSTKSSISFELWLPETWSGRFLGTGNGGIDGCLQYEGVAYAALNGFAAFGTNNGHNGTTAIDFLNNKEVGVDFAWRSLHTGTVSGKKLTKIFYGKEQKKSYYLGCSLGGRMGLKTADKFPNDFDGIVAGAPAVDFNNLVSWRASFFPITGPIGSSNFITSAMWGGLIHNAILAQCDHLDGVTDGIIEDPTKCNFDPSAIQCQGDAAPPTCLNAAQISQVKKIFAPYVDASNKIIYPGMQPGSEALSATRLYAGVPFAYSDEWFKYVVYSDPSWNASTYSLSDAAEAERLNPGDIKTYPDSFKSFAAAGGKILSYHGQQDNQITSFQSNRFYDHLLKKTPQSELEKYYRTFRISGMNHCNGGPGAWVFGQGGGAPSVGIPFEKEKNILAAMVAWVERGIAPETIEGTKFTGDTVANGVSFTRRHCRYPKKQVFTGGDHTLSTNWRCE
ncbi:hypothetical protein ACEPPN_015315 [Leptodophora sp. 'Broadleaf-Isolate-01']